MQSRAPLPLSRGPRLRDAMRAEHVGPFRITTDDAGTVWVCGHGVRDEWRAWSPAAALTPERVRQLVRAIDEAPDRTTLARLAHVISRRYGSDPCTPVLAEWIRQRGRALTPTPRPR